MPGMPMPGQQALPPPGAPPVGGADPYAQSMEQLQERAADVRAAYERLQYERALLERERLAARLERDRLGGGRGDPRDERDPRDAYDAYLRSRGSREEEEFLQSRSRAPARDDPR